MAFVILGLKFAKDTGAFLAVDFGKPAGNSVGLAYPWFPALGVLITLVVGGLLSLRHRTQATPPDADQPPAAVKAA
jgi:solute:Na+ symporter, SSS family